MTDLAKLKIAIDTRDFDKASIEMDKLERGSKKAEKSFISLNATTVTAVASIYLLQKAVSSAVSKGIEYNKAIEQAKSGIVALSVAMQDRAIPVQERYRIAQLESIATLKELQRINLQTPHTLEQTNQIYKAMYSSMKAAGASTSEIVEVTRSISIAAGAAGIEFRSLLSSVDGLASGTVLANGDLGRFLNSVGLTNDTLRKSDNVVKTISERLKDFKALGTYTESVSNFDNAWSQLTGKMTADIFEGSKQGLNELSTLLNSMSDEDINNLKSGMNELGIVALNVVYGISSSVIELTNAFDSLGARLAGVAFRVSEGVFLNDEETAALDRMYQKTKDNIKSREEFIETLRKSKEAMEESISINEKAVNQKTKQGSFDINAKGGGEVVVTEATEEEGGIYGPTFEGRDEYLQKLEQDKQSLLDSLFPLESIIERDMQKQELIAELEAMNIGTDQERKALMLALEEKHQANINKVIERSMTARQKFEKKNAVEKTKFILTEVGKETAGVTTSSKKMFEINKMAAMANAAVQLPGAVMKTLEAYPAPYNFAMAALVGAAGVQQISAMSSATFGGGGGGATSVPTGGGGFTTTPGVAPSDMASPADEEMAPAKEVTINLGDSAFVSTEMVRELVNAINEEIGDGVVIRA